MSSQSPGVSVTNVIDPTFDRSVEFGKGDVARAVFRPAIFQLAGEFDDVARLDAAMSREHDEAQPGNSVREMEMVERRAISPRQRNGCGDWRLAGRLDEGIETVARTVQFASRLPAY